MKEDERPTIFPLRVMHLGLPPATAAGRLLVRHKIHGYMIGEMLEANPGRPPILCAVGIETGPERHPVCIRFVGNEEENCVEWMAIVESFKPIDRIRANAHERKRQADDK